MAVDKLVDSIQLDSDLTSVANAIRTKGGTSAQMAFPSGFVSAVQAIPSGGGGNGYTLLKSGSYTYSGAAAQSLSIPVTYTGTAVYAYAVVDEIIANTNQSYCFVALLADELPFTQYLNGGYCGITSAVNTSGVINTNAINNTNRIGDGYLYLGRASNTYLIQPNTYNWFIYGIANGE